MNNRKTHKKTYKLFVCTITIEAITAYNNNIDEHILLV